METPGDDIQVIPGYGLWVLDGALTTSMDTLKIVVVVGVVVRVVGAVVMVVLSGW